MANFNCRFCGKLSKNDRLPRAKVFCSKDCYTQSRTAGGYTYHAIHTWLWRNHRQDKIGRCSHCWREGIRTEWANKIAEYTLDIANYIELCKQCHEIYDGKPHDLFKGHKHSEESKAKIAESVRRNRWNLAV